MDSLEIKWLCIVASFPVYSYSFWQFSKMLIILSTGNTDFTKINKIKQNNINFREQLRTRQSSGRVQIQILESEISSEKSSFGVKEDLNSLIIYFSGTF